MCYHLPLARAECAAVPQYLVATLVRLRVENMEQQCISCCNNDWAGDAAVELPLLHDCIIVNTCPVHPAH